MHFIDFYLSLDIGPNAKKAKKSSKNMFLDSSYGQSMHICIHILWEIRMVILWHQRQWTTLWISWNNIFNQLKQHFPDRTISKKKIKDHIKHIKAKFNSCYDLFKNGLSGFAWDASKSMWIAELEVWDKLIKVCFTRKSH